LPKEDLLTHGRPEVFNSDQGVQFTSEAFTGVLKREGSSSACKEEGGDDRG
jgi:hypothetical protein